MKSRKLLDEVRAVLRIKNYSYRTEKSNIYWIRKFILYHNKRHPRGGEKLHPFMQPAFHSDSISRQVWAFC